MSNSSVRPLSSLRPLSSFRIRTALKDRPRTSSSRSNSSAQVLTTNTPQSRDSSRPSTEPIGDVSNDASHLTVGPALQGNSLKALLARKKSQSHNQRPSTPSSNEPLSETVGAKTTNNYKLLIESIEKNKETDEIKFQNRELRDEIMKWRKEHVK